MAGAQGKSPMAAAGQQQRAWGTPPPQGNMPNANQGNLQPRRMPNSGGLQRAAFQPNLNAAGNAMSRKGSVMDDPAVAQQMAQWKQQAAAPQAPAAPWDPSGVTKTMDGQRVGVDATGNTIMGQGGPMLANAQGRGSGQVLGPNGTPVPPSGPPPSQFQQIMDRQFGQGNPFGQMSWYGDNPLQTAQNAAQQALDKNLAGIRARYGAAGTGNSARAGIAEGTALGEMATGLGDVLSQRGLSARSDDLGRLASMFSNAGQQDLMAKELALKGTQGLANLGTGYTGIGAQEQGIPNMEGLLSWLATFSNTRGGGRGGMTGGK